MFCFFSVSIRIWFQKLKVKQTDCMICEPVWHPACAAQSAVLLEFVSWETMCDGRWIIQYITLTSGAYIVFSIMCLCGYECYIQNATAVDTSFILFMLTNPFAIHLSNISHHTSRANILSHRCRLNSACMHHFLNETNEMQMIVLRCTTFFSHPITPSQHQ